MKFTIKSTSVFFFVLIFLSMMILMGLLSSFLWGTIANKLIAVLFSVVAIISSYLTALKLTSGIAEINLNSKRIEFNWIKKPIFTLQNSTSILNNNLIDCSYQNVWFYYDYIKLNDSNSKIVLVNLFNPKQGHNDDFYKLKRSLKKRLNKN